MTEDIEVSTDPEAFDTDSTDMTGVITQIIAFVGLTAATIAGTRFVMNRFEARKAKKNEAIEVTSSEV